jgi:hypothetical protein
MEKFYKGGEKVNGGGGGKYGIKEEKKGMTSKVRVKDGDIK